MAVPTPANESPESKRITRKIDASDRCPHFDGKGAVPAPGAMPHSNFAKALPEEAKRTTDFACKTKTRFKLNRTGSAHPCKVLNCETSGTLFIREVWGNLSQTACPTRLRANAPRLFSNDGPYEVFTVCLKADIGNDE